MTAPLPVMCCVSSNAGRYGEPIACAYPRDHEGAHSWASLPTFAMGEPVGYAKTYLAGADLAVTPGQPITMTFAPPPPSTGTAG